jgi:hypothetical protein
MKCSRRQFVYLLENLLVFHAMYKCGPPLFGPGSSPSDADDLLLLLRKLVAQIIMYCPRQEGNKWKLQKLHERAAPFSSYVVLLLSCQEL